MSERALPNERFVRVTAGDATLDADLCVPENARGLVAFAHGAGSSRHSPRNRYVAQMMHRAGLATLLTSILTVEEEADDLITGRLRFDIALLGRRLIGIVDWLRRTGETSGLRIGLFGSSTGAAGALIAAAERPDGVAAVVSRGGRPDLAAPALDRVKAPTLLIVGSHDFPVIDLNRRALASLKCEKELVMVPGAGHLFEEPGALEQVAQLAGDWFVRHFSIRQQTG